MGSRKFEKMVRSQRSDTWCNLRHSADTVRLK